MSPQRVRSAGRRGDPGTKSSFIAALCADSLGAGASARAVPEDSAVALLPGRGRDRGRESAAGQGRHPPSASEISRWDSSRAPLLQRVLRTEFISIY